MSCSMEVLEFMEKCYRAENYKPPVLSFDIMEMVGENVKYIREKVWLSEHKQEMSKCFQEMSEKWSEWKASEEGEDWLENIENYPNNPENILENNFNFLARNDWGERNGQEFWMNEYNKQYLICWDDPSADKGLWDNERDGFCPRFGVW